ncbi:MAG: hypothetical protein KAR79_02170 [Simkaniaceae bacterium]|nr:hypothetical protein [Simkaniaceae bacterium]
MSGLLDSVTNSMSSVLETFVPSRVRFASDSQLEEVWEIPNREEAASANDFATNFFKGLAICGAIIAIVVILYLSADFFGAAEEVNALGLSRLLTT